MSLEVSAGRRKKKLAVACELLVYGALRELGLDAYLYERRGGIPVEADIVVPKIKTFFLIQHQVFTNQRYPFFNKVDQVLRTKFKRKVILHEQETLGKDLRVIGVFLGPMWAEYHLAIFDFFSDGAIGCPFSEIFKKEAAAVLEKLDSFARGFINIKKLMKISKDQEKLDEYYENFKRELQRVIPKNRIDEITSLISSEFTELRKRPLNRNISSILESELAETTSGRFVETRFPVDLYDVFFGLVLLGEKFKKLRILYNANVKGTRSVNFFLKSGITKQDIKLLSDLKIKGNEPFVRMTNNEIELTPLSYNLMNALKQMDEEILDVLQKLVNEAWADNLVRTWLLDLHQPERPLEIINFLRSKIKEENFAKIIVNLIEEKKWYAVEVLCKILRVNKEEIPQEILKMDGTRNWPKRPTPDITNKPDSLTPERIRDIVELFQYKVGGIQGLKEKIGNVDLESFGRYFEDFRRKQLVGKLSSPQKMIIERELKKEKITFFVNAKEKLQDGVKSLSKFITQKEKAFLGNRTIFSSVLLPPYKILIPTKGSYDIAIWCKTDLTGSNEGFVRAKMKLSCYTFDTTQKKIIRNRTLPVLVTDFSFGAKKAKEKYIEAKIQVFELNSVPMLEKLMKFIKEYPVQKKIDS